MTRKIIACICVLLLSFAPTAVYAQDTSVDDITRGKVAQIKKGAPAPFEGVLLSSIAAATLFGDLKFSKKECALLLKSKLKLNTEILTGQLDLLTLKLEIEENRSNSLMKIKNERIEFLEKSWQPNPWYQSGEFWLAVGVVSGVLITVASGHAIGQASKN